MANTGIDPRPIISINEDKISMKNNIIILLKLDLPNKNLNFFILLLLFFDIISVHSWKE